MHKLLSSPMQCYAMMRILSRMGPTHCERQVHATDGEAMEGR